MPALNSTRNSSTRKLPRIAGITVGMLLSVIAAACSDSTGAPVDAADLTGTPGGSTNDTTTRPTGPLAGIRTSPGITGLQVGSVVTFTVYGVDANGYQATENPAGNPTFAVENSAVATVTQAGQLTAVAVGNTNMVVTWGAFTKSIGIFVSAVSDSARGPGPSANAVAGIYVNPRHVYLTVGRMATVAVFPVDANGTPTLALLSGNPTWSVANPLVATVNSSGQVTAIAQGTTTLNATWGGFNVSADINVFPDSTR